MRNPRLTVIGLLWSVASVFCLAPKAAQAQPNPSSPAQPAVSLAGTTWSLMEVGMRQVPQNGLQPYFRLRQTKQFANGSSGYIADGSQDCGNNLIGPYRASGDHLYIRAGTTTLVACMVPAGGHPKPSLSSILQATSRFRLHGAILELTGEDGTVKARFIAMDRE